MKKIEKFLQKVLAVVCSVLMICQVSLVASQYVGNAERTLLTVFNNQKGFMVTSYDAQTNKTTHYIGGKTDKITYKNEDGDEIVDTQYVYKLDNSLDGVYSNGGLTRTRYDNGKAIADEICIPGDTPGSVKWITQSTYNYSADGTLLSKTSYGYVPPDTPGVSSSDWRDIDNADGDDNPLTGVDQGYVVTEVVNYKDGRPSEVLGFWGQQDVTNTEAYLTAEYNRLHDLGANRTATEQTIYDEMVASLAGTPPSHASATLGTTHKEWKKGSGQVTSKYVYEGNQLKYVLGYRDGKASSATIYENGRPSATIKIAEGIDMVITNGKLYLKDKESGTSYEFSLAAMKADAGHVFRTPAGKLLASLASEEVYDGARKVATIQYDTVDDSKTSAADLKAALKSLLAKEAAGTIVAGSPEATWLSELKAANLTAGGTNVADGSGVSSSMTLSASSNYVKTHTDWSYGQATSKTFTDRLGRNDYAVEYVYSDPNGNAYKTGSTLTPLTKMSAQWVYNDSKDNRAMTFDFTSAGMISITPAGDNNTTKASITILGVKLNLTVNHGGTWVPDAVSAGTTPGTGSATGHWEGEVTGGQVNSDGSINETALKAFIAAFIGLIMNSSATAADLGITTGQRTAFADQIANMDQSMKAMIKESVNSASGSTTAAKINNIITTTGVGTSKVVSIKLQEKVVYKPGAMMYSLEFTDPKKGTADMTYYTANGSQRATFSCFGHFGGNGRFVPDL